jgi:molybdopterin synthase catalytic subunit
MPIAVASRVTEAPISAAALAAALTHPRIGGLVTFEGLVRDHNEGHAVSVLEYHAFAAMAERQIDAIILEAQARWPGVVAAAAHRIGPLQVGEVAVAVVAASPHRAEAFDACRYIIDTLKRDVPIWKKETGPDGTEWLDGQRPSPEERG